MRVRDLKTGRFANHWKAKRWPGRFQIEDVEEKEGGDKELLEDVKRVKEIMRDYARGGTLLRNFDLETANFSRDRFDRQLFVVTMISFSEKGNIVFSVQLDSGDVSEERGYKPQKGRRRR